MAFAGAQVAVSTTPALLSASTDTDNVSGQSVGIITCDVDIYLGGTNSITSSSNSAKLPAGTPYSTTLQPGESLYAVTASGTGTAHVTRQGI